ncbi:unnamed protein product [Rhizoctonia solani]|uniref:NACHT domain-containing protein n=1 Tax=Rhizoctonia solani TaxID=456999 RepID=A0A8H3CXV6_9AGAM|nr:unnamed protein product [Rhizoctonia solani]
MSSPPGTPKHKKGIRQLLKQTFRSRSRSPPRSLPQLNPTAPSAPTRSDEALEQIANPGGGRPLVDSATAIPHQTGLLPVDPSERFGGTSRIPIIIEPADAAPTAVQPAADDGIPLQSNPTATETKLNTATNDPLASSNTALEARVIIEDMLVDTGADLAPPASEDTLRSPETNESQPTPPVNTRPDQGEKGWNAAWGGLRRSLRFLKDDASSLFPHFSSAIESLLSCLNGLEVAVQNRQDFEDLATELSTLSESLQTSGPASMLMSGSITSIAMAIERQTIAIKKRLARASDGGIREVHMDQEDLIKHYRKIQSHFRQLQINASMSTWSIANENLVVGIYQIMAEGLNPAKQATYDSSLSTQISRRACTEGTRIGVLDSLDSWLYDSTSSSIYWMNGMAGTGKSTIASTFCERVERRKLLAANFFCTRSSAECRDVTRIVPTIAYQLARYSISFQSALCKILGQSPDIGSKNVLKQFEQLLKEPLQQVNEAIPDNLVVVIDALDECDDRNGVELVLDILFRHAAHIPLKFIVTSRPEPEIYNKMTSHAQSREAIHLHDIEEFLVREDIELYLKEELGFMSPPASQAEIEQLVRRAGTLFIYAATLVRYIRTGKRLADPHKRLRSVLDISSESTKKHTQIDALYRAVLKSALNEDELEADEIEDIRNVLRTVLLAQEPIDAQTIAELALIDDSRRVVHALQPLRSVLHQSEKTGLVSTLHASFPDFMFNNERSGSYFYDIIEHSQLLARRCFSLMKRQLRFNICDLASSFVPDKEVENIQQRIQSNISPTLSYACCYWARHLVLALHSDTLVMLLDDFLCNRLLFWMEVLSLLRELPMGIDGLLRAQQWLTQAELSPAELVHFVHEVRGFMTSFAVNPTSLSTPHIYLSSLFLCPRSHSVYKHYGQRSRGLLELKGSLMELRESAPLAVWNVDAKINSLALSPDGTRLLLGSYDATVRIVSAYDGSTLIGPLHGHTDDVVSVAFSSDGERIVSASRDGIRVWNAYNGTLLAGPFRDILSFVFSIAFSPDGTCVVSGARDGTVQVWAAHDGTPLFNSLPGRLGLVSCVIFSPNGAHIAASSGDHTIQLWDSVDGTPAGPPFKGHNGSVNCLAFTPDSTRLVSGSDDGTIRIWNVPDGSLATHPFEGHSSSIKSVAVSPDGMRVVSSGFGAIILWNIDNGAIVAGPFYGPTASLNSLAYSPDGTRVIYSGPDYICVRSMRDGMFPGPRPSAPPQDVITGIKSVVFNPNGTHILTTGRAGALRIWDATEGSYITSPNKAEFMANPFSTVSPDGSCIISTHGGDTLQVINMMDGSLAAGPFEVERSSISTLQFSRNNRAIIIGCLDGAIKVCDLQSGNTTVGSFVAHHKRVSSISESPDCSLLVSHSDYEMAIRVWNIVDPALDLQLFSTSIDPASGHSYPSVYDGWRIREDGWVVNDSQHLLFWLPPDLASAWCSPYATLVITQSGTLQVPRQKLFIGDQWTRCYVPD